MSIILGVICLLNMTLLYVAYFSEFLSKEVFNKIIYISNSRVRITTVNQIISIVYCPLSFRVI
jgi:hypothetical protein